MVNTNLQCAWDDLVAVQQLCRHCIENCDNTLIHENAIPLFGRFKRWERGLLFVFEAPNLKDTIDHDKKYLTYDRDTDETCKFTRKLMIKELRLDPAYFQVTNSVLCLPRQKGHPPNQKYPVSGPQRRMCAAVLEEQIRVIDPLIVVAVGGAALDALRQIEQHNYKRMADAVACPKPWAGRWLFPLYHTSKRARGARKPEEQEDDWRRLRQFALEKGAFIPMALGEICSS